MSEELIVYRTYATIEDAQYIAELFDKEGIQTQIVTATKILDTAIGGGGYEDKFILRIPGSDFNNANKILREQINVDIQNIDPKDPMLSLSKEELLDVIARPDEWGPENFNIAKQLLTQRGVNIPENVIQNMEEERIEMLSERKPLNPMIFIFGDTIALINIGFVVSRYNFFMALNKGVWFFPGFFGIIIGILIFQSKTTLPNGERIYTYNNTALKHALIMLGLNILAWIINILALIFVIA